MLKAFLIFFQSVCLSVCFCQKGSVYSPSCPGAHCVNQADLKFLEICLPLGCR